MWCELTQFTFLSTNAKYEIAVDETHTPIKQDIKKGKLRYIKYGNYPWNYGALPQTWEDPNEVNPDLNLVGNYYQLHSCFDTEKVMGIQQMLSKLVVLLFRWVTLFRYDSMQSM